jgi:hypothetical protein
MARRAYGEPYDPEMRVSELGSRLYQTWRRMRKHPHVGEWDYYPTFYHWSIESGYSLGTRLCQVDESVPFGPDNCLWHIQEQSESSDKEWVYEWNRAVNRIRKHYGMPPLEGTNYDDL